ncbi:hypothetical protein CkaCkLH20_10624 [Colletotrichum karsti]|uniref:Uncharacterized protein n=1 Tax=Colletotrichum karsti TaxID=1095194 RepID=A0A9P6HVL6_9PEZI|nr:uncharacterized protein CkaCkLH20_10624 [Colletotrichum karsti]KAF9871992.1 hypothetical protein CkaCkLH20_10624 [Colletotrichum karsti]
MSQAAQDHPIKLPGFGLPLNHKPESHFPTAVDDWFQSWPHTIRERCMVTLMEEVTLEKDWDSKAFSDSAISDWKKRVMAKKWRRDDGIRHGDFTETMFECFIEELQGKAKLYQETGIVPVLDIEVRLARSDKAITPELNKLLQKAAVSIQETSTRRMDWNAGKEDMSGATVSTPSADCVSINLIDPNMYPLIYGRSRVLPDKEITLDDSLNHIAKGVTIPTPSQDERIHTDGLMGEQRTLWSGISQWLPTNISFPDGVNAKITSYINNLHPKDHADVYPLLEEVVTRTMPLWNVVYATVYKDTMPCDMRMDWNSGGLEFPGTAPYDPLNIKDDLMNGLIDDDEWQRRTNQWLADQSFTRRPEPLLKKDKGYGADKCILTPESIADKTVMLGEVGGIQVVVKMSAVYLTPENPVYDSQSEFALDGALNDRIAATAVYFFDDDNVTDSRISFKSRFHGLHFEEECWYNDGDERYVEQTFGFRPPAPSLQDVGSVTMREGLMVAYPNVLQHKNLSYRLKDPTRPGHRKVLTLYLVDPRIKVLSTANVPPQQAEWWVREFARDNGQVKGLPKEVVDMVVDNIGDIPIPRADARRVRDEVVAERRELEKGVGGVLSAYIVNVGFFSGEGFDGDESVDEEDEDEDHQSDG